MIIKVQPDHVLASFGNREVPYSNWHYTGATLIDEKGREVRIGRSSQRLRSPEGWEEYKNQRIGKPVGFGEHPEAVVKDVRINVATYSPHPDRIRIAVRDDAHLLLTAKLSDSRPPSSGFTGEEQASIRWLRENAGRRFAVVRDEDAPQMTPKQFFNTMPEAGDPSAPAGYFLPRGLCRVLKDYKPANLTDAELGEIFSADFDCYAEEAEPVEAATLAMTKSQFIETFRKIMDGELPAYINKGNA